MYCIKCGKELPDDAKFCAYCGAKIEVSAEMNTNEDVEAEAGDEEKQHHIEDVDWDISSFPDHDIKKTEDIDFDWNIEDGEFGKRVPEEPEIAFGESLGIESGAEEEKSEGRADSHGPDEEAEEHVPFSWKDEEEGDENSPWQKVEVEEDMQRSRPSMPEFAGITAERYDEEGEKDQQSGAYEASFEEEKGPEEQFEEEKEDGFASWHGPDPYTEEPKEVQEPPEDIAAEPERDDVKPSTDEEVIAGDELEKELFGDELKEGEQTREAMENTKRIDRFYTFSKKNEEFQDLLDKQYEKVSKGEPLDDENDLEGNANEPGDFSQEEWPDMEEESQVAQMRKARQELFGDDEGDEPEKAEPKEPEKAAPEPREEISEKKEGKADWHGPDAQSGPDAEDEPPKKKGGATKVLLTILTIIVIVCLVCIGIRICAPDSVAGVKIGDAASSIVDFFQGSRDKVTEVEAEKKVPAQDKTAIIQLQTKKNYKNSIDTIKYTSSVRYSSDASYSNNVVGKLIKTSKPFKKDNKWYVNKDGKQMYIDGSLLGKVIDRVSRKAAAEKKDNEHLLEIGEIRTSKGSYFVWTRQTDGTNDVSKSKETVYEISVSGHKMEVKGQANVK